MTVKALLPHGGDMRLVDELVARDETTAHARARLTAAHPFLDEDGRVPAWLGLEMMAQAVAAWSGERGRAGGEPPRMGYLLACRSYESAQAAFDVPAVLDIHVRELMRQDNGFGSYSGEIVCAGQRLARGKLSVMETDAPDGRSDGESE